MVKTDEVTQTDSRTLIVCEILCYIQNKMDKINHDYIVKTVVDFYNESDIHAAKNILFGCCRESALRLKTYRIDAAKLHCRDIITKMNEIGTDCPSFVVKNISLLPIATPDAFDLANITNNIGEVMKLESTVLDSFGILGCLQRDLGTIMEKFKVMDSLIQSGDEMKLAMDKRCARRIIESDSSSPESDSDIDTDSDSDNDGAKSDSSVIDDVVSTDGAEVHHISDAIPKNSPLRLRDGPPNKNSWMTDGGFNMVKQKNRVIVNSNYDVSHPGQSAPKLRAVRPDARDYKSQHGGGRGVGRSHHKTRDVTMNLKSRFNRNFRVEQLQTKYDHYASFKVTVPMVFKKDLLNKDNWDDRYVFVKPFVKRTSSRF